MIAGSSRKLRSAVQLEEVVHQEIDVVEHVRARRVPRELHLLLRRQLGEHFLLKLARLLLELADLAGEVDGRVERPRSSLIFFSRSMIGRSNSRMFRSEICAGSSDTA